MREEPCRQHDRLEVDFDLDVKTPGAVVHATATDVSPQGLSLRADTAWPERTMLRLNVPTGAGDPLEVWARVARCHSHVDGTAEHGLALYGNAAESMRAWQEHVRKLAILGAKQWRPAGRIAQWIAPLDTLEALEAFMLQELPSGFSFWEMTLPVGTELDVVFLHPIDRSRHSIHGRVSAHGVVEDVEGAWIEWDECDQNAFDAFLSAGMPWDQLIEAVEAWLEDAWRGHERRFDLWG